MVNSYPSNSTDIYWASTLYEEDISEKERQYYLLPGNTCKQIKNWIISESAKCNENFRWGKNENLAFG